MTWMAEPQAHVRTAMVKFRKLEVLIMITIEKIDDFRKRTNSSYEDARFFLERHQGNVLEAIIDFEKSKRHAKPASGPRQRVDFWQKAAELIQKGFDLRMSVEDAEGQCLFTVPVLLLILLLPGWPFVLFGCLGLVLLGYKLSFRDIKSTSVDVKKIFEHIGEQMRDTGRQHAAGSAHAYRGPVGPKGSGRPVAPHTPHAPTGPMAYGHPVHVASGTVVASGKPDERKGRVAVLSGHVVSVQDEPAGVVKEEDGFVEYTVE